MVFPRHRMSILSRSMGILPMLCGTPHVRRAAARNKSGAIFFIRIEDRFALASSAAADTRAYTRHGRDAHATKKEAAAEAIGRRFPTALLPIQRSKLCRVSSEDHV